jgi:hypothetical protein
MTQDLMPDSKPLEKSPKAEKDGFMCITLELSIPCFKISNYDMNNIDKDMEALVLEIEESKELKFAQRIAELTGLSVLEHIPGAKAFYNGLVGFTENEELKIDGNSSE